MMLKDLKLRDQAHEHALHLEDQPLNQDLIFQWEGNI